MSSQKEISNNKGTSTYDYEFTMITDLEDMRIVPVYQELTEEQRDQFRAENPDSRLVPTKIKVGEDEEQYTIKKNIKLKRRVPDVRNITFTQTFNKKGKVYSNRFLVEDTNGKSYVVVGSYDKFKEYINTLDNNTKRIGY